MNDNHFLKRASKSFDEVELHETETRIPWIAETYVERSAFQPVIDAMTKVFAREAREFQKHRAHVATRTPVDNLVDRLEAQAGAIQAELSSESAEKFLEANRKGLRPAGLAARLPGRASPIVNPS